MLDANGKDQTQAEDSFRDIFINTHIHLESAFYYLIEGSYA